VMERLRASLASEGVEAIIERYGAAGAHTEA
jgi:hypothetical protein